MKVLVAPDQMRNMSNEILSTLVYLSNNLNAIELMVAGLEGEWKGNAEKAFASQIIYVRSEFRELENFIRELAELLARFSEEYERHDDEIASKIKFI